MGVNLRECRRPTTKVLNYVNKGDKIQGQFQLWTLNVTRTRRTQTQVALLFQVLGNDQLLLIEQLYLN